MRRSESGQAYRICSPWLGLLMILLLLPAPRSAAKIILVQEEGRDEYEALTGVVLSPDGRFIYATDSRLGHIAVFSRNLSSGRFSELFELDTIAISRLVMSPDGAHLYGKGKAGEVLAMQRDPGSGGLAVVQTLDLSPLIQGQLAVSPDGSHLYVTGFRRADPASPGGTLAVLARNPSTGELSLVEVHENGVAGVSGLSIPGGVAVTPDGTGVYVASNQALVAFRRDPSTGELAFVESDMDGGPFDNFAAGGKVAVSPDSAYVYMTTFAAAPMPVFQRDPDTSALELAHFGPSSGRGLWITDDGTRAYNCGNAVLLSYGRNPGTGELTEEERISPPLEASGRTESAPGACFGMTITPDGQHLYTLDSYHSERPGVNYEYSLGAWRTALFREDFEDQDPYGLTDMVGSWGVTGPGAQSSSYAYSTLGTQAFTLLPDSMGFGSIEVDFNIDDADVGNFLLFFQSSPVPGSGFVPENGYFVIIFPTGSDNTPGTVSLVRIESGVSVTLGTENSTISAQTFHHLKIQRRVDGPQHLIEVYLDGSATPAISVDDSTHLLPGRIWLGFNVSIGSLDNILADTDPLCADGVQELGEQCDDGNNVGGDGCSAVCEIEPLEHYMFYKSKVTKGIRLGTVVLSDQFGSEGYEIRELKQLGLPADKNGEGVVDAVTHLAEYQVKAIRGTPRFQTKTDIQVINQCHNVLLEVKKPKSVLVPTLKDHDNPVAAPDGNTHNVDHFLCYQARVQRKLGDGTLLPKLPRGTQVEVSDQFQTRRYDLKKITKLCNPTAKSGSPVILAGPDRDTPVLLEPATIRNAENHLVCYQAKLARKNIPQAGRVGCGCDNLRDENCVGTAIDPKPARHTKLTGLHINNQFGPLQLDTIKEFEFCIPSEKILPD